MSYRALTQKERERLLGLLIRLATNTDKRELDRAAQVLIESLL